MSTRKKVANLWAPLLQSKGNSTTQPMSQKAVSDELSQLKSDLDTKIKYTDILTFEQIQASTTDLTNKVASASSVKNKISSISNIFDSKTSTEILLPDIINQILFFSTFDTCGLYIIRKESPSAIFLFPVKEADGIIVTISNNSIILNNSRNVGGNFTLIY